MKRPRALLSIPLSTHGSPKPILLNTYGSFKPWPSVRLSILVTYQSACPTLKRCCVTMSSFRIAQRLICWSSTQDRNACRSSTPPAWLKTNRRAGFLYLPYHFLHLLTQELRSRGAHRQECTCDARLFLRFTKRNKNMQKQQLSHPDDDFGAKLMTTGDNLARTVIRRALLYRAKHHTDGKTMREKKKKTTE